MPTRAELLADHFIRCTGIAAIAVQFDGAIVAVDAVSLFDPRPSVFCCAPGNEIRVAALAAGRVVPGHGHDEALAAVHAAAAEAGIGLTPFDKVIRRAFMALEIVDRTLADMQAAGQLRDFNREFSELRRANPRLRYQDHLHARKLAMVEALAKKAS